MKFPRIRFLILLLLLLISCQTAPKRINIGYVQITQDPVLDAAKAGLFKALADSGFIEGKNIRIFDNNAQGDLSMINMILQSLKTRNVDMIITNSTPCMSAAAQTIRDVPVVFTVAFSPDQIGLKTTPENLYGMYDPLKTNEFADLLIECIPDLDVIGIPYNNSEPNAEYSAKMLTREFSGRGIKVLTSAVNSTNDIMQAGEYLADRRVKALVAAADNTVYLGLPVLAKLAADKKIPLFVTDPLQAEKGAAIGLGVNYEQWGYQSGLKAVEILKGRAESISHIDPIIKYDLLINLKACESQGLKVPESVRVRARRLIN
jgi:putative tryptophan/tyrosine transport system substrate-binding protein